MDVDVTEKGVVPAMFRVPRWNTFRLGGAALSLAVFINFNGDLSASACGAYSRRR